jgi:HD-GYP domain-containing protein (c-di-GMP phosphodiesterase class II)
LLFYTSKGEKSLVGNKYDTMPKTDIIKFQEAEKFYASFLNYTQCHFIDIAEKGIFDIESFANKIKMVWHEIRHNRRFLLYAHSCAKPGNDSNYIVSHSVSSSITSMIIGTYFKFPNHRLMEVGIAALLHDLGMLKLSPEAYLTGRVLTADEKKIIRTHPIHGFKILQSIKCPTNINLGVLDHHEREDGSGYPRKLSGNDISLYAKIISVASSYEALCAKRLYKESKDRHTGILELLKNEEKHYNDTIVKALAVSLSIYPIGLSVLLSDGQKAQVIDIDPFDPYFPQVKILEYPKNNGEIKLIQTSKEGISIARPLTNEEIIKEKEL